MGVSVYAKLKYGFKLEGDEGEWLYNLFPDDNQEELREKYLEDWLDIYCEAKGLFYPEAVAKYHKELNKLTYHEQIKCKMPVVLEKQALTYYNEKSKLAKECEVCLDTCGGYDYPGHIVVISSWGFCVEWTQVEEIPISVLLELPTGSWDKRIQEFCEIMKIPYQKPGFILTAEYS